MSTADMIGGYRSGAREVVMPIAPLFHGNGWQMVYTAPMNGHKLVLPGRNFEPRQALRADGRRTGDAGRRGAHGVG